MLYLSRCSITLVMEFPIWSWKRQTLHSVFKNKGQKQTKVLWAMWARRSMPQPHNCQLFTKCCFRSFKIKAELHLEEIVCVFDQVLYAKACFCHSNPLLAVPKWATQHQWPISIILDLLPRSGRDLARSDQSITGRELASLYVWDQQDDTMVFCIW